MTQRDKITSASFVQEVVTTHGARLRRYLAKRLRPGEEVQDLAQEVYLRLLRLHRSDLVRQPAAYVHFLAAQVMGEARMKAAKRPLIYDSDLLGRAADDAGLVQHDRVAEQEHARRELEGLLARLGSAHRAVFVLRKRDGFSTEEIAEKLRMSHFKVKRYLVEAGAKLDELTRKQGR